MVHANPAPRSGLRDARLEDIPLLSAIETMNFDGDRVSRRSFRHLISRGQCRVLVNVAREQIRGYVVVLFRSGSQCARIYSIATHPQFQRRGVGKQLIRGAQLAALARGCTELRLEIRTDNAPSIHMFQQAGCRVFGHYKQYYEDGMDALRLRKMLCDKNAESSHKKRNEFDQTCKLIEYEA
jgi:ribosomal protein S18 acetylase RimI-like enzyme